MQGLYKYLQEQGLLYRISRVLYEDHQAGAKLFERSFHINLRGEVLIYKLNMNLDNQETLVPEGTEEFLEDRGDKLVKINGLSSIIQLDTHRLLDNDFTVIMVTADHRLMLLNESHDGKILETEEVKFIKDICSTCYVVDIDDNLRCIDWVKYELTPIRLKNVRWIEQSDTNLLHPIFMTHDGHIITGEHNMFEKNHLSAFKVSREITLISRNATLIGDKAIYRILMRNRKYVIDLWTRLDHRPVHIDYRNEILHTIDSGGILRRVDRDHLIESIVGEGQYQRFVPYKHITYIEDTEGNLRDLNTLKIIPFSDQLMDVNKFKKLTKSSATRI